MPGKGLQPCASRSQEPPFAGIFERVALVGREEPLARIDRALERARAGGCR
jgi:hypothetical protein